MIDGIKIHIPTKQIRSLKKDHLINIGGTKYRLRQQEHCHSRERLMLTLNREGLTVEGSISYAMNDNSFEFNESAKLLEYVDSLSDRIETDLLKGTVKYFEAGVVLETPFKYKEFIHNHVGVQGMLLVNNNRNFQMYKDELRCLKFYNAKERLHQMVRPSVRKDLMARSVYNKNKNYLKYELKYLKPSRYFKMSNVYLRDLCDNDFNDILKGDLINTYQMVNKTGFEIKGYGSDFDLPVLLYATLKKVEKQVGNIDVNEMLLKSLDVYSNRYKADGKSRRKKLLKELFHKLKAGTNPTDISQLLKSKLNH